MSELLKHSFGLADGGGGRRGWGVGGTRRGGRGSVLLTGNNGPQISVQVSPGPPEACLIQLEPR